MSKKIKVKTKKQQRVLDLKNWRVVVLAILVSLLFLPVIVVISYHLAFLHKIYPHVVVAQVDLSNKSVEEAEVLLTELVEKSLIEQPAVTLSYMGNEWHVLQSGINFRYLPEETAKTAYGLGRGKNFWENMKTKQRLWFKKEIIPFEFGYSQELLENQVASVTAELDIPIIPPQIEVLDRPDKDGSWVRIQSGEPGQEVKREELKQEILRKFAYLENGNLDVPIKIVDQIITDEQIQQTKARANELITKTIVLKSDEQQWSLKSQELVNLIDFTGGFDETKVNEYVKGLAQAIDRPAQNAAFQYVGGKVTEFKPAKAGLKLDQEKTGVKIMETLDSIGEDQETFSVNLEVLKSEPEITLAEVNDLGIKELLGRGYTTYYGSIASRVYNISLASQRLNGLLVPPGGVFSFNNSVGEVSTATGYKQAYVIRSGATVLDDGGGLCQVSTTTFRAALDAGLPILERRAHAYRVGYYEQNAKAGLDATVYAPSPDLKFKNDTSGHILVQYQANTGANSLTVEIYGTDDGRQSQITNHRVWDIVSPPPPRYEDDPSLPAGTVKQIDWAASGAKAKFDYIVTRGGETIYSKTFYSNFRPWQAVYLRGV